MIAAPCDLVWQAWTDPGHVMQWWGPHGAAGAIAGIEQGWTQSLDKLVAHVERTA